MKDKLWPPDKRLHLPAPVLVGFWLELGVWNSEGKLIHQQRQLSRSPLKQFLQALLSQFNISIGSVVKDTSGTLRSLMTAYIQVMSNAGEVLWGLVLGTDNTPVDMLDYKLITQILEGSGVGQLLHQGCNFDADVTVADPDCTFDCWRNFNNNSGASITVREAAIYSKITTFYFCIVRDVPAQIVVPNGGGCYIKYTAKITE